MMASSFMAFQSSPGRKAGRFQGAALPLGRFFGFNPHPAARPGASSDECAGKAGLLCFNPHPAARPGASSVNEETGQPLPVSIHTRPQGRALRITIEKAYLDAKFQSSPGRKAGRFLLQRLPPCNPCNRFNPHPAARPGASLYRSYWRTEERVSILTRPQGRALRSLARCQCRRGEVVSILTRPQGRALLRVAGVVETHKMFQSSPGRKAGRFLIVMAPVPLLLVSILTRPQGRALPTLAEGHEDVTMGFNPHPAARPGASV